MPMPTTLSIRAVHRLVDTSGNTVYLLPQKVHAVLIKDVYQAYDEKTLMLADRAAWDRL